MSFYGTYNQFLGSFFVCGMDLQRKISSVGAGSHQPARSPFLHETRIHKSIRNSSALSNNAQTMVNAVSKIYVDCKWDSKPWLNFGQKGTIMREQGVRKVETFSVEMQIYNHACLSDFHIFSSKFTETPSFFTGMGEERVFWRR